MEQETVGIISSGLNILLQVLTLLLGGGIGTFIGIKWKRKKEKEEANQAAAQTDTMTLANVNEVVELYKRALQDMKDFKDKDAAEYHKRIDELEAKLNKYEIQLEGYRKDLEDKNRTIEELTRSQLKLKTELDEYHSNESIKCENCQYKKICEQLDAMKQK